MTFDFIVGNPPYQMPNHEGGKGSQKLYFKITKRMTQKFRVNLAFVTPRPQIMPGSANTSFSIMNQLKSVNPADEYFNEKTNAIWWVMDTKEHETVKYQNKQVKLWECYHPDVAEFWPLLMAISYRHNNYPKLKIKVSHSPIGHKASELGEGDIPVIHQSNGQGPQGRAIKYTNITKPKKDRIIIPYASKWFTPFITGSNVSEFFGVIDDYPRDQWDNIISYLRSETIKKFIQDGAKISGNNYFNMLWQLPEVDFSRPWTNQQVQDEFITS